MFGLMEKIINLSGKSRYLRRMCVVNSIVGRGSVIKRVKNNFTVFTLSKISDFYCCGPCGIIYDNVFMSQT